MKSTPRIRVLSLLLSAALLLGAGLSAFAVSDGAPDSALAGSAAHILSAVPRPQVGSTGGEWAVIGLARSGCAVPQDYWDNYYAAVEACVKDCKGVLHEKKYTEYCRVILALTAIGADPTDVGGYDLTAPLADFDGTVWQGINGPIWALIALDSGGYSIPAAPAGKGQATRQMYVEELLSRQLDNGGWSLNGRGGAGEADADVTGMALQALAAYREQAAVRTAVDKALACLSGLQRPDGGFSAQGAGNSETLDQVIVALCTLGVDLSDSRFVKNGHTLLDAFFSFRQSDGSFLHTAAGGNNQMASEQGLYTLAAIRRAQAGKSGLYQMNDVTIRVSGQAGGALPGRHADVKRVPVSHPGATFADIAHHPSRSVMEAMAARGIINGKTETAFEPDATMTRAEFAAIVVRALGLTPKAGGAFDDVPSGAWYAPYVGTASTYGIINGKGERVFDPNGTITRQEAAVMVARAARLCGMDTARSSGQVRDLLAQFSDYRTVAGWAEESVAFCYDAGIWEQSDLNVTPGRAILRWEVARMLYSLLDSSALL